MSAFSARWPRRPACRRGGNCCSACCRPRMCRACVEAAPTCRRPIARHCSACPSSTVGPRCWSGGSLNCRLPANRGCAGWPAPSAWPLLPELPFSFDLSDLRGYHYHNGVVFAAYCPDYPAAIALGGVTTARQGLWPRAAGDRFFDGLARSGASGAGGPRARGRLWRRDRRQTLAAHIAALREQGEIVVELLPGEPPAKARFATASWRSRRALDH
jgi:hypothetical protein